LGKIEVEPPFLLLAASLLACELDEDIQMVKRVINIAVLSLLLSSAIPASIAQSALQSSGATGNLTNTNGNATLGNVNGWSNFTTTNGSGSPNGPNLAGTNSTGAGPGGSSGAATSAPFQGTYYAPSNIAARQFGGVLQPTQMTSFVADSGYNDFIYGDEGTDGPPPYDDFGYINDGISSSGLTTGHPSGAPSAWGYPQ